MGGDVPGVRSIVSGVDIVAEEYDKLVSCGAADALWSDWDSDWEHGANWQVIPVYASRELANKRLGSEYAWEAMVAPLAMIWPSTWALVFDNFNPSEVELVAFSRLRGNQELEEHSHNNPGHKIFHMGIDIPEGDVGLSHSSGEHTWEARGDWVVFDDNENHRAWNRTDKDRVVFYMDLKDGKGVSNLRPVE